MHYYFIVHTGKPVVGYHTFGHRCNSVYLAFSQKPIVDTMDIVHLLKNVSLPVVRLLCYILVPDSL